jgi:flagellar protein FlaJ
MTAAIVVVMTVVTLIIGSGDTTFMLGFGTLTVLVTLVGVWLIYTSAPRENKNHSLPVRSREQNIGRFLFRRLLPTGIVAIIVAAALGLPLGGVLLAAGVILFPVGLVAIIDDGKMTQYEMDISGLLRSLGGVTQATNITINEALSRLDFRSLVSLKDSVELLYTRIQAGLDPRVCWDRLVAETGSELVVRSVRVFLDSIAIGGQPERVGREAGSFAMRIALLRNKRATIAAGLLWLVGIMHIILVTLVTLHLGGDGTVHTTDRVLTFSPPPPPIPPPPQTTPPPPPPPPPPQA